MADQEDTDKGTQGGQDKTSQERGGDQSARQQGGEPGSGNRPGQGDDRK